MGVIAVLLPGLVVLVTVLGSTQTTFSEKSQYMPLNSNPSGQETVKTITFCSQYMYSLQPVPDFIETKSGSKSHSGFFTVSFGDGLLAFVVSSELGKEVLVTFVVVGVDVVGEKVGGLGIPLMHAPLVCPS
jgi:Na+/proline symporter